MSIYFYGCISLDGYLADKNHQLDWLDDTGSVEETSYDEFYRQIDIIIMGRKTFDFIAQLENFESFYGTTKNYVFTHKNDLGTEHFTPISGDIVQFVKDLPDDKNTWIVGGNTLLAPLLDADLMDTLIVQVAPVLLGEGIPLFTQKEELKRFNLIETKQYGQFAELVLEKKGLSL